MDVNETFEEDLPFVVEPFQFEPPAVHASARNYDSDDSSSESDDSQQLQQEGLEDVEDPSQWCICSKCSVMPTQLECRCCHTFHLCMEKMRVGNLKCVTEHQSFIDNCLNTNVLELAFYDYLDFNGPVGDEEPIHKIYRYIAYRRFTRWIWHRLGKNNRKVIPACVVTKIRETFPSEHYTGFQYPRDY